MKRTLGCGALIAAIAGAMGLVAAGAQAQLAANQTLGFAKGQLKTFTYTQQFDCVDEPGNDLNFNTIPMESDPLEIQTPICRITQQPTINPSGTSLLDKNSKLKKSTHLLFVLVPMFSVTPDTDITHALRCPATSLGTTVLPSFAPNVLTPGVETPVSEVCGDALGTFLVGAFGSIPDAFRIQSALDAGITTQCPNPTDPSGSCTTHTSNLDLAGALKLPGNVITPTPNHTHVIDMSVGQKKGQWWEVIDVAVNDPAVWPTANDPTKGLTSLKAIRTAQATASTVPNAPAGTMQANPDAPSNFFLFFGVQKSTGGAGAMAGMPGM